MKKKNRPNNTQRAFNYSIWYQCPLCEEKFATGNELYTVKVDDSEAEISDTLMFPRTTYTISFGMTQQIADHLYQHYHGLNFPEFTVTRGGIQYASNSLYELGEY